MTSLNAWMRFTCVLRSWRKKSRLCVNIGNIFYPNIQSYSFNGVRKSDKNIISAFRFVCCSFALLKILHFFHSKTFYFFVSFYLSFYSTRNLSRPAMSSAADSTTTKCTKCGDCCACGAKCACSSSCGSYVFYFCTVCFFSTLLCFCFQMQK